MSTNRREFIRKVAAGTAAVSVGGLASGMSARSYNRIIGANDRINMAIAGLGRRLDAYIPPISNKDNNVELLYLCDVMKSQRERAAGIFSEHIKYSPKQENDIRKVIADPEIDLLVIATPDH